MAVAEGDLLWTPSPEVVQGSNVVKYMDWLREQGIVDVGDYLSLWRWSVDNVEVFWASLWDYFDIISDTPCQQVTDSLEMKPGNRWFIGSKVNFAEHILRHARGGEPALYYLSETRPLTAMDWDQFSAKVRILATRMREMGVQPGDPICSLMPNIPETVIAMLAAISVGALWSNAAPEFGRKTILDRFSQIEPKWLFVADGYTFGGKPFDKRVDIMAITDALSSSLQRVVYLPYLDSEQREAPVDAVLWDELLQGRDPGEDFRFERVPHDHPLWVLFSSGTTGLPKAIVHSHQGALLEISKVMEFHLDLRPEDVSFFYTTTGWVMFTLTVGMMIRGAKAVFYDGNPAAPTPDVLWKMAADSKATIFGASPTYVQVMEQLGVVPKEKYDLSNLRMVLCSGSPAQPESFEWFYRNVNEDIWLTSQSGGTEIVGGFVAASPTLPVYAGEIQCPALGMDVDAWSEKGESLVGQVGELVCKQPFPSMPIYFLNDPDDERYRESYFEEFPGVWRHGDFIKINEHGGSYIYGRSDSTLNRFGVRIGTAELYRVVEKLPEVVDSLVVCIDLPGGNFFMPMFLQLAEGVELSEVLQKKIAADLRENCSPRHVPDKFYSAPEIPYTLTGKKLEVPVRKLLLGWSLEKAASRDSLRNPGAIDYFLDYVATTRDYKVPGQTG